MSFAVICSGQGAQAPELFQSFPFSSAGRAIRDAVIAADALEPDVAAWLSNPDRDPDGIYRNHFSQPLICLFQLMVWAELSLPTPRLIAGYSVGEVSAYGCAGALSPAEVVRLAGIRARLMDAAGDGCLFAVTGLSFEATRAAIQPHQGHVAIVLAADHCVIGGPTPQSASLQEALLAAGAAGAVRLKVSVPSHTPLLDGAVEPFREILGKIAWHSPVCPVLAGIDATKIETLPRLRATLPDQIHATVRWDLVQQRLAESGCRVVLELGPGRQLAHTLLAHGGFGDVRSVEEFRTAAGVSRWLDRALERA